MVVLVDWLSPFFSHVRWGDRRSCSWPTNALWSEITDLVSLLQHLLENCGWGKFFSDLFFFFVWKWWKRVLYLRWNQWRACILSQDWLMKVVSLGELHGFDEVYRGLLLWSALSNAFMWLLSEWLLLAGRAWDILSASKLRRKWRQMLGDLNGDTVIDLRFCLVLVYCSLSGSFFGLNFYSNWLPKKKKSIITIFQFTDI